ncbi:MAG: hypothetical protein ABS94_19080 [Variovorax sp. SCN 67-85]|nr:MAG: hypothetical protein ABS94_19080 [Variovorax sp. SCN 67-85]ODV24123.1 MAG: hypothetical protein ABT25_15870 [Variovorax sp. SCN 67-20]
MLSLVLLVVALLAGAAGAGVVFVLDVESDPPGVSSCGNVARWAAAGSVGRYRAPFWPQAARPVVAAARQTMSAARTRVLTRIWRTFNIAKL